MRLKGMVGAVLVWAVGVGCASAEKQREDALRARLESLIAESQSFKPVCAAYEAQLRATPDRFGVKKDAVAVLALLEKAPPFPEAGHLAAELLVSEPQETWRGPWFAGAYGGLPSSCAVLSRYTRLRELLDAQAKLKFSRTEREMLSRVAREFVDRETARPGPLTWLLVAAALQKELNPTGELEEFRNELSRFKIEVEARLNQVSDFLFFEIHGTEPLRRRFRDLLKKSGG